MNCYNPQHLNWLDDTGQRIQTSDGIDVELWELHHQQDNTVLSLWAKHFREHYCKDCEIDLLRSGTGYDRKNYLVNLVFPDKNNAPGPSIRAGDFAEILLADFLEYILGFWVPRYRYDEKNIRNESTKGADIIGFKYDSNVEKPTDTLMIFEVKAKFTGNSEGNRLQDAIDDSIKDYNIRKAESLNALKRRLIKDGNISESEIVARFQNQMDHPYKEDSGAAAVFSSTSFNNSIIVSADSSKHPNNGSIKLIVISGDDLMTLTHELYRRAADEAGNTI
ncbi:MAG: Virulence associated protein [uncultured bacterium]|nr:MAG: Virulence associated protein [uncultured bacterium]